MIKKWLLPQGLQKDDKITLFSPGSPPITQTNLKNAVKLVESIGLNVNIDPTNKIQKGYLAGPDHLRYQHFMKALKTHSIKAIITARGGYGTMRLLEHLDPERIRLYPKILTGYSDITALHLAYFKQRVFSFWGPMPAASTGFSNFSQQWFKKLLFQKKQKLSWPLHKKNRTRALSHGTVSGRLTGGTLTLLAASIGTWYEVETKNNIIFIEDIGEEPYKIDRMLTQLLQAGKLKDANGIIVGHCKDCIPNNYTPSKSFTLLQVIKDRLVMLNIPIIIGFPIGHIADQYTLPYGAKVCLNTQAGVLELLENVVA